MEGELFDNQIIRDRFIPFDTACNFARVVNGRVRSNRFFIAAHPFCKYLSWSGEGSNLLAQASASFHTLTS